MKFENSQAFNFEGAFRGMRNPLASWDKSDSAFGVGCFDEMDNAVQNVAHDYCYKSGLNPLSDEDDEAYDNYYDEIEGKLWDQGCGQFAWGEHCDEYAFLGPNDMDLAKRLIAAGPEHRKFLRQIFVSVDITAPLFWWKEMDTYKLGTVANSTSTMHKLASTPITIDCFETDDIDNDVFNYPPMTWFDGHTAINRKDFIIDTCEQLRKAYLETKDKRYWKELVRWLPEGWLQTRTWTANYEVLRNIYHQRKGHKLTEWETFRRWVEALPYAKDLICE